MARKTVAIFSVFNDLHALTIQRALQDGGYAACHVVETDALAVSSGLSWTSDSSMPSMSARLRCRDGAWFDIAGVDLIWWRRANRPQRLASERDDVETDLINNEWRSSLFGVVQSLFRGVAVDNPANARTADNKLVQISAARGAGLRTPRTLVSQVPADIRSFCADLGGEMVIKPIQGTHRKPLSTVIVRAEDLPEDADLELCPAMYQEVIPGNRHLRVHCFGAETHAFTIESTALDWRRNLNVPFSSCALPSGLKAQLRHVLQALGLKMGVFDLKIDAVSGEPVWLEVNPQGQFLFIEGLTGYDLTTPFVRFLVREMEQAEETGSVSGR